MREFSTGRSVLTVDRRRSESRGVIEREQRRRRPLYDRPRYFSMLSFFFSFWNRRGK